MQLPAIMTGTISVEDLSGAVSVCRGSMVGVPVAVTEGIVDLVLATEVQDGVAPVGQSIRKFHLMWQYVYIVHVH